MSRSYVVKVPLEAGTERWFDLCRCLSPEAAAEVVQVLIRRGAHGPYEVKIAVEGWDEDQPL